MNWKKRAISLLLALVFVAALLPTPQARADWTDNPCPGCGNNDWVLAHENYASCTEGGARFWMCNYCYREYTEIVPATGHSWREWGPDPLLHSPTCTEAGQEARSCSACGARETRDVGALGHAWDGGTVKREASCTEDGSAEYRCERCGVTETRSIAALGHAWDEGKETKAATCTEDGSADYSCTRCDAKETRKLEALGHDWEEKERTQPEGIRDGQILSVCRRCGEEKKEAIPTDAKSFFASLRNLPLDGGGSDLRISKQPMGGVIARDSGESLTVTVEVQGGVPPYRYEWHCESLEEGEEEDKSTPVTLSVSAANEELLSTWQGTAASWYDAHVGTYEDVFNSDWLSTVTGSGKSGVIDALLDAMNPLDQKLGSTEGPEYEATRGNCSYWVEVFDDAGDSVKSEGAWVIYKLRIAEQPRSVNWNAEADEELQAVFLECKAADGSGEYRYEWFKDEDFSLPYDISARIGVVDLGRYVCRVTDVQQGEMVESDAVEVYEAEPFKIKGVNAFNPLWPGEEAELAAWCTGGVPPYEVWWDHNGTPLDTRQGAEKEGCPAFYALSTAGGLYTAHATDAMGATDVCATVRYDRKLSISQQPVGAVIPKDRFAEISVVMADGEAPYTYELYRNGQLDREVSKEPAEAAFSVWYPGNYYFHIEDSEGHTVDSDVVYFEDAVFRITAQSEAEQITAPRGSTALFVEAEGGVEPYTYTWTWRSGKNTYDLGRNTNLIPVFDIGEYSCVIEDKEGQRITSKVMQVSYGGEAPWIVVQPHSRTDATRNADGSVDANLFCNAISGSGDNSKLKYIWEMSYSGDSGWAQTRTTGQWLDVHELGLYRCQVVDTVTGKYTYSEAAAVAEPLDISVKNVSDSGSMYWFHLQIDGGLQPCTVKVYQLYGGNYVPITQWTQSGVRYVNLFSWQDVPSVSASGGFTGVTRQRVVYYAFEVTDTLGNKCYKEFNFRELVR